MTSKKKTKYWDYMLVFHRTVTISIKTGNVITTINYKD